MIQRLVNSVKKNQIEWLIIVIFIVTIILEYSTPPPFVFGYIYIGSVLLANAHLPKKNAVIITTIAVALTILNLAIPGLEPINLATVANRCIAVIAIVVTAWLSDRNRHYQDAIARQKMQLLTQQQLASTKEDFASTLTHDLKTPLLGAIQTLKAFEEERFGAVTAAQRQAIEVMIRSHKKTLHLVETALDIYRNDIEGLHLHKQPLNLVQIAEEAIADLTDLATSRQICIRLTYANSAFRPTCWIQGDAVQLHRVFANLLANGINHTWRGGSVEVQIATQGQDWIVKIIDDGQGIASNQLPLLFERFYQVESDRAAGGTGLGLYLSRQIIEAHGGTIWAEQRSPRGAIFSFRLQAYETP
jgi:two-component system NarL family sensor kinase